MREIKFASTLPVPSVLEMMRKPLTKLPSRYMTVEHDQKVLPDNTLQLPVINLEAILAGDELEFQKMDSACREWGFFQLINHGVDPSLVEEMKSGVEGFFKLPMEDKNKVLKLPDDIEGFGQVFVFSEEQKLDWCDRFHIVARPAHLRKPRLFDNLPPKFRETLISYSTELEKLAMKLLLLMAKAVGIKEEEMKEFFEEGWQDMRLNYYPPCPQPEHEHAMGLRSHSDGRGLTILLQATDVQGLQVMKDGTWVPVKPLPNAFIVNIGNILEVVTNGNYHSVQHRVCVNSDKERFSATIFLSPKVDGVMGPAPSIISPESPPLFRTVPVEEFLTTFSSQPLLDRTQVDNMRIASNSPGAK